MEEEIKNEHLNPVFSELIPRMSSKKIKYWVYGGVAIAGVKGKFYRKNADVDVFVLDHDFEKTKNILTEYTNEHKETILKYTELSSGRPKIELKPRGSRFDWFSVVPVRIVNGNVEFKFNEEDLITDRRILDEITRHVSGHTFITPPDNYIKMLFKHYLKTKRIMDKNKVDAKDFLSTEDLMEIFRVS